MTKSAGYSSLDDVDENSQCQHCHAQKPSSRWKWLPLFTSVVLAAVLIFALFFTIKTLASPRHRILPKVREGFDEQTGLPLHWYNGDCGNSPEEAEARGCHYNFAVHVWLPKGCYTDEDVQDAEEMYQNRDHWYYETNGKNLTMDEVRRGHYHNFTSTWETHMAHCVYTWKRLHRALLNPATKIDAYTINYYHSEHCAALSRGYSGKMEHEQNVLFAKYPVCA